MPSLENRDVGIVILVRVDVHILFSRSSFFSSLDSLSKLDTLHSLPSFIPSLPSFSFPILFPTFLTHRLVFCPPTDVHSFQNNKFRKQTKLFLFSFYFFFFCFRVSCEFLAWIGLAWRGMRIWTLAVQHLQSCPRKDIRHQVLRLRLPLLCSLRRWLQIMATLT